MFVSLSIVEGNDDGSHHQGMISLFCLCCLSLEIPSEIKWVLDIVSEVDYLFEKKKKKQRNGNWYASPIYVIFTFTPFITLSSYPFVFQLLFFFFPAMIVPSYTPRASRSPLFSFPNYKKRPKKG